MGIVGSRQVGSEVTKEARVSIQLLREIELDVLACLDRNSVDIYEMVSKQKRAFVHRHRHSLPLRAIHSVHVLKCHKYTTSYAGLCNCGLDSGLCIALTDGRRLHTPLSGNTDKASVETAAHLRNGSIDFFGMFCCVPCGPMLRLSRNYAAVDNCRVNDLVLYERAQPTAEIMSLACDVWKGSTLEMPACFESDFWRRLVVPKLKSLIVRTTMTFLQADKKKHFVWSLEVQTTAGHAAPAPLPSLCVSPSDSRATTSQIFGASKRYTMDEAVCLLYEFANRRRCQTLRVYVATTQFSPIVRLGGACVWVNTCYAYCLRVYTSNSTE